ncbi:hypothetical protein VTN02DRAFT_1751 [Thermoascus thermophilus]
MRKSSIINTSLKNRCWQGQTQARQYSCYCPPSICSLFSKSEILSRHLRDWRCSNTRSKIISFAPSASGGPLLSQNKRFQRSPALCPKSNPGLSLLFRTTTIVATLRRSVFSPLPLFWTINSSRVRSTFFFFSANGPSFFPFSRNPSHYYHSFFRRPSYCFCVKDQQTIPVTLSNLLFF